MSCNWASFHAAHAAARPTWQWPHEPGKLAPGCSRSSWLSAPAFLPWLGGTPRLLYGAALPPGSARAVHRDLASDDGIPSRAEAQCHPNSGCRVCAAAGAAHNEKGEHCKETSVSARAWSSPPSDQAAVRGLGAACSCGTNLLSKKCATLMRDENRWIGALARFAANRALRFTSIGWRATQD